MFKFTRALCLFFFSLLLGACASPYYDPVPPGDVQPDVTTYASPLTLEESYRRLYARLSDCVSGFYHVQPRYDAQQAKARIMVVAGLGLNRYSFIGNSFRARFDIYASSSGSRIKITNVDRGLRPMIATSQAWLTGNTRECHANS